MYEVLGFWSDRLFFLCFFFSVFFFLHWAVFLVTYKVVWSVWNATSASCSSACLWRQQRINFSLQMGRVSFKSALGLPCPQEAWLTHWGMKWTDCGVWVCLLTITVYQGTNNQSPALDGSTGGTPGVMNATGFARVKDEMNMNTKLLSFYGGHVGCT